MKVALINAPRLFFKNMEFSPATLPLAIANLYGYLNTKKIDTIVFDLNVILMKNEEFFSFFSKIDSGLGVEEFISKNDSFVKRVVDYLISAIDIEDCDILGISIIEDQSVKIALPFIRRIKDLYPDKKIVVGGEFFQLVNKEKTIDFFVLGRGEEAFLSIIRGIQNKTNPPRIVSKEFDFINQVTIFDSNQIDNYRFVQETHSAYNDLFNALIFPYKIGEGCSYNCSFCSLSSREVKYKKPEQIVEELKKIKERYNYKYFYFLQEHLTISKSFIQELCDRIIDSRLDILWSDCIKPLRYLSQDLYYKLREAGCIRLSYGIETGSPKIMQLMNKGHSVLDCENNLKYAHKAGIFTEASFIEGFPTEGEKEFNETLNFIKRNKDYLDKVSGGIFRLELKSFIMENPEKYNLQIKKMDKHTGFIGQGVYEYDEIGGLKYEELKKLHTCRLHKVCRYFDLLKKTDINYFGSKVMVFPLTTETSPLTPVISGGRPTLILTVAVSYIG